MSSKSQSQKVKKELTALLDRADQTCQRVIAILARMEAIAGDELGACFFSNGSCEQLTEGTCLAVGGISWLAGAPCPCPELQPTDQGTGQVRERVEKGV
jgi:hypothetical protein